MTPLNSIDEVYQFLNSVPSFRASGKSAAHFELDRFRLFCKAMGDPQKQFAGIHVGGTNGKGSTSQILASIYQQAGYNTGLYTSPHILHFTERFRCNGKGITDNELVAFFQQHSSVIKSFRLSYFEISTAIAFWWFAEKQVDLAVIEVGLGGRLDATNIINSVASVITNVSRDHTDILGDTIQEIAREKAGIIKPEIPVILGNISDDARSIIEGVADKNNSSVYGINHLKPMYKDGKHILYYQGTHVTMETGLEVPVQVFNVAVAWQTVHILNFRFPVQQQQVTDGIIKVRERYPSLGRFDQLLKERQWYFDGGHNYEAIKSLKEKVETIKPVQDTILVLSLMRDKIDSKVINEFLEFKKILYHSLDLERAAAFEEVQQWLPKASLFPADHQSREMFFKEIESELVIFAGSFYFYSTVRDWLASFALSR